MDIFQYRTSRKINLEEVFKIDIVTDNFDTVESNFKSLQKMMNKELRLWWDVATLERYLQMKMVPQQLRWSLQIYDGDDSSAAKDDWWQFFNHCGLQLVSKLVTKKQGQLRSISQSIEELQHKLEKDKNTMEFTQLSDNLKKIMEKEDSEIQKRKQRKMMRDLADYQSKLIYRWQKGGHHSGPPSRAPYAERNHNNQWREGPYQGKGQGGNNRWKRPQQNIVEGRNVHDQRKNSTPQKLPSLLAMNLQKSRQSVSDCQKSRISTPGPARAQCAHKPSQNDPPIQQEMKHREEPTTAHIHIAQEENKEHKEKEKKGSKSPSRDTNIEQEAHNNSEVMENIAHNARDILPTNKPEQRFFWKAQTKSNPLNERSSDRTRKKGDTLMQENTERESQVLTTKKRKEREEEAKEEAEKEKRRLIR